MDKYIEGLARAFASLSGLPHDEVRQQTWLEYLELKERFPVEPYRGFIKRFLWSQLSVYCTQQRSPVTVSQDTVYRHRKGGQPLSLHAVELEEDHSVCEGDLLDPFVLQRFDELPEICQAVLWVKYWLELTNDEASELLGVKFSTVKHQIRVAHKALRGGRRTA